MRVAVAGLGFMGSTHIRALQSIPGAELVAVCSRDEKKLGGDLSGVQGNLGGPGERLDFSKVSRYREIRELLDDPNVDAVDLCLPTQMHASAAIEAVQAGKHVLVEKPMALDAASAREMIAAAAKHRRVLMVAQVLRFFPMYEALQKVLARGKSMGEMRSAIFRRRCAAPAWSEWLGDPEQSGGGVFDLLIHDVDMCLHLFGKPEAISATGYEALGSGIDVISATLHYPGQRTAVVTGGWHHPKSYPFLMEYTVVSDGGTVEYSSLDRPPVLYSADGEREALPMEDKDGYRAELEYFLECCRKGVSPELCKPQDSADAVTLTLLMLEARKRNGEKIPCDL
ncbi:MAG TPA: Gfo/Idh/MocA family oxidoreductase [Bryobacteraceae bacterium]|nr:Gfo/Idh/MocA family oxidoreductase [Bryobacteraceae bacterium]